MEEVVVGAVTWVARGAVIAAQCVDVVVDFLLIRDDTRREARRKARKQRRRR
ncbi:hypothetical protein [Streptomyces sp. NPDC056144]|uniref:hypothetical protein n=1 Tax=unclassified Streptomyces TaxID=2593676 RepID=UPI0035D6B0AE